MTVKQVLIVVHQPDSNPGLVGQLLQELGYTLDIRCPAIEQPLPSTMDHHAAAIVFGGPMSANDDDLPFIRAELDWIPTVLTADKPYLGICLGAQLLARTLGAVVAPHPQELREIGYFPIVPTAAGASEFERSLHVYHWHKEGFEVPRGAVLLAKGETFTNQAFRYGRSAYGVQFHPEITQAMIETWTTKVPEQLFLPGAQSLDQHFAGHAHHSCAVRVWLENFLDQWLSNRVSSPA
ncbi:MAG: glutamine amidotransferase [Leptolyngbyaceae cyanobacterium SL_7_1]|nr:glutamine amidotransferase [Leptolyngbyaceae cyanobacterium SL_7_1]